MSISIFFLKAKALFIRFFFKLLTVPLIPLNYYLIKKYGGDNETFSPIFIIGAPRTGSTILYQGITNQFDVLYFDNLSTKFSHMPIIGFWLSEKMFRGRAHNCFNSKYGNTNGYHSPNESGEYWIRFLPKDRHFIDYSDISSIDTLRIKSELTALFNMFGKPIVFKNLNAGQRMRLLKEIFPDSKFINIRREALYTAQSILECKRKQGIDDNDYWSIKSKNFKELEGLEWYEQIPKQVYFLEKQIHEDKHIFPNENIYELFYSDLCSKKISEIGCFLKLKERPSFEPINLNIKEGVTLELSEINLLKKTINSLDWQFNK